MGPSDLFGIRTGLKTSDLRLSSDIWFPLRDVPIEESERMSLTAWGKRLFSA